MTRHTPYVTRNTQNTSLNPQNSLPGPDDITRVQLPNGITILARANHNSPSVVINGYILAGALFDTDEKLGLANFTAGALMRGTERRDFQQIYDDLESAGASFSFSSATHTVGFGGKALAEDLNLLLRVLAESLRQPTFPQEQIVRLRAQLMTSLAIRAQSTGDMASLAFDQIIYRHHPYRRPEDGYPETVQAIGSDDFPDFHGRHYGPRRMVVTVVGAVEPSQVVDEVTRVLADWENPDQPEMPVLPAHTILDKNTTQRVEIPGKSQADIVLGVAGPPRKAADFLAATLGNSVLGQFGLMGRIGDVVREQAGLAYYAFSSLSGGVGPGPWSVAAGVAPANVEKAIDLICAEIARFVAEPVTAEELSDSKANFVGRMPLALETNAGVASALINIERHDLGLDYYRRFAGRIAAISREEILATAQNYLHPDRLGIAIAGP